MLKAGIDIGSRTIKLVITEADRIMIEEVRSNSYDPIGICRDLLDSNKYDKLVATGYGRHLLEQYFDCEVITEIKAVALGACKIFPDCKTILDIGGQDTKSISLDSKGKIKKFEMNDKCAAGTGKFLEIMATALGYSMEDFISSSLVASKSYCISQMCTVFAESEVIGLMARETPRDELARGLHESVSNKAIAMLKRVKIEDRIVFCGGAANNTCLKSFIEERLGNTLSTAKNPQTVAALGCTLI